MPGPTCYYPDHSVATNHTSCNAGAAQSWCCAPDSICLDNGYCLQTTSPYSNRLGRHSCTDKTWSSQACPSYCADNRSYASTGIYLASDKPNGVFCCTQNVNTTTGQCQMATKGSKEPFYLPDGNIIYNRSSGAIITKSTLTRADLLAGGIDLSRSSSNNTSSCDLPVPSHSSPLVAVILFILFIILFVLSLLGCGFLWWQNRKLKKERSAWLGQVHAGPAIAEKSAEETTSPAPVYAKTATGYSPYAAVAQTDTSYTTHEAPSEHMNELPGEGAHKR